MILFHLQSSRVEFLLLILLHPPWKIILSLVSLAREGTTYYFRYFNGALGNIWVLQTSLLIACSPLSSWCLLPRLYLLWTFSCRFVAICTISWYYFLLTKGVTVFWKIVDDRVRSMILLAIYWHFMMVLQCFFSL